MRFERAKESAATSEGALRERDESATPAVLEDQGVRTDQRRGGAGARREHGVRADGIHGSPDNHIKGKLNEESSRTYSTTSAKS